MATSPAQLIRTVGFLALLVPLVVDSLPLSAQSQSAAPSLAQAATASQPGAQPSLRFEVVSIRPRQAGANEGSSRQMFPGGRFVATGTTVRTLIRIAFATDDNLISGAQLDRQRDLRYHRHHCQSHRSDHSAAIPATHALAARRSLPVQVPSRPKREPRLLARTRPARKARPGSQASRS
jgi:hypothetical protein